MNNKKPRDQHPHHHFHLHISKLLMVVVLLLVVLILMITPTLENFSRNKQFKALGLDSENVTAEIEKLAVSQMYLESNVSMYKNLVEELQTERETLQQTVLGCSKREANLSSQVRLSDQSCQNELAEAKHAYDESLQSYELEAENAIDAKKEAVSKYETLAKNAARSICCKSKVDDANIDSYDIVSNSIVCSDDGKFKLDCS